MKTWTRRQFGRGAGAAGLTVLCPHIGRSQARARVIVIGGGIGGVSVAKYLAQATPTIDVTLVEPGEHYTTCFLSSLYLAGYRPLESLVHGYETLAQRYGVAVVRDAAAAIDPMGKTVRLKSGATLPYDRAVVAPGITFKYGDIEGYDEAAAQTMPHAWTGGPQIKRLRQQLESMEDGGVFLLAAPPNPYRCPPAPYERVCLVAAYFRRFKPRAKILVIDAKDSFFGQNLFEDAWNRHYPGMIEWLPAQFTGGIKAVDVKARSVMTEGVVFDAAVINIIPPQKAGSVAQQAGLAGRSGWCPVDPLTFESTLQAGIHLVGDAIIAGDMPKSAFSANNQAKACAFAIKALLTGAAPVARDLFNTCYTHVAPDDAWSIASGFRVVEGRIKATHNSISKVEESAETRRRVARDAESWYAAFMQEVTGAPLSRVSRPTGDDRDGGRGDDASAIVDDCWRSPLRCGRNGVRQPLQP
jgi:sulfide dehydrogenase [flavocytochrome c] flavoprotein chain